MILRRSAFALTVAVLLMVWSLGTSAQNQSSVVAFTHVNVIDTVRGAIIRDMTVLVTGSRIAEVARTGTVRVPSDAKVIDASGQFMMPGLWDMHVHWYLREYLPLFIANGVTGVRQMWGQTPHYAWRDELRKGTLSGPRQVIASQISPRCYGGAQCRSPIEAGGCGLRQNLHASSARRLLCNCG